MRIQEFSSGGGGGGGGPGQSDKKSSDGGGGPGQSDKKSSDDVFFFVFSFVPEGVQHFPGGGDPTAYSL